MLEMQLLLQHADPSYQLQNNVVLTLNRANRKLHDRIKCVCYYTQVNYFSTHALSPPQRPDPSDSLSKAA